MTHKLAGVVLLGLLSLGHPLSSSLASPVRVDFAGTITSVNAPQFGLGPFTTLGAPFAGYFVFDPALLVGSGGSYSLAAANHGYIRVDSGTEYTEASLPGITISDAAPGTSFTDFWSTGGAFYFAPIQYAPTGGSIVLRDPTGTAISSSSFFVPQSLAGWGQAFLEFRVQPSPVGPTVQVSQGNLTSWSVTAPEPGAAALIGLGLLLFGWRRAHAR